jgi:hypothetical protein
MEAAAATALPVAAAAAVPATGRVRVVRCARPQKRRSVVTKLPSSSRALLITCRSGRPALVVACRGGRRRLPAPLLPATGAPPHGDVSVYVNGLLTSFPCPAVSGKKRLNLKKYLLLVDNGTSTVAKISSLFVISYGGHPVSVISMIWMMKLISMPGKDLV